MPLVGVQSISEERLHNAGYRLAMQRERDCAIWFSKVLIHHQVAFATPTQNVQQDIDIVLDDDATISFKHCEKCRTSGNISFETRVWSNSYLRWMDGWYKSGRADWYVFEVAADYYLMNSWRIKQYVLQNGFDEVTPLGKRRKQDNENIKHDHRDALNGLIKLDKLIHLGLAKKIGTRDDYSRPSQEFLESLFGIAKHRRSYADTAE